MCDDNGNNSSFITCSRPTVNDGGYSFSFRVNLLQFLNIKETGKEGRVFRLRLRLVELCQNK